MLSSHVVIELCSFSQVYLLHAKPEDYFQRLDGGTYSRESYYANPHLYKSIFHEKVTMLYYLLNNSLLTFVFQDCAISYSLHQWSGMEPRFPKINVK